MPMTRAKLVTDVSFERESGPLRSIVANSTTITESIRLDVLRKLGLKECVRLSRTCKSAFLSQSTTIRVLEAMSEAEERLDGLVSSKELRFYDITHVIFRKDVMLHTSSVMTSWCKLYNDTLTVSISYTSWLTRMIQRHADRQNTLLLHASVFLNESDAFLKQMNVILGGEDKQDD